MPVFASTCLFSPVVLPGPSSQGLRRMRRLRTTSGRLGRLTSHYTLAFSSAVLFNSFFRRWEGGSDVRVGRLAFLGRSWVLLRTDAFCFASLSPSFLLFFILLHVRYLNQTKNPDNHVLSSSRIPSPGRRPLPSPTFYPPPLLEFDPKQHALLPPPRPVIHRQHWQGAKDESVRLSRSGESCLPSCWSRRRMQGRFERRSDFFVVGRPPARDRGHQLDLNNAGPLASRSTRVEEYLSRARVGRPKKARVRERWWKEGIRGFERSHE